MSVRSLLARLTGWPMITTKYRAHWRVMIHTHPLIIKLLEDNADGDTRRASLAEWHRAERPVLSVLRGTTSLLRIDGPRQFIGKEDFAMGALIESPGVTAHLDPVDTFHLEARLRQFCPALTAMQQTQKHCGAWSIGLAVTAGSRSNPMSGNLTKWSQKRGCDTTYRARSFDTHPTHVCIPHFSRFSGGLCARALFPCPETDLNQPFYGRVNGAHCEALS